MKIVKVRQGSPEWVALRINHLCASDAPAMMGVSKHTKRSELVRMKATGDVKEFSEWEKKNLLEKGQGVEPKTRALIEEMLGEELYPITATDDEGRLLASLDGITMSGKTGFECKLWNADLVAALRAGEVPAYHHWQLDHQIAVCGFERIIFVCSDGTRERFETVEYRPSQERLAKLRAGWKQFEDDVLNYQHTEILPAPRGRALPNLPLITVAVSGKVTSSNLAAYKATALEAIDSINTALVSDQDFADADEAVKFCKDAEEKLEEAKTRALASTATVADLFNTFDELREAMRQKRLDLEKLVDARKKTVRVEIMQKGAVALREHIEMLNKRLGKPLMPTIPADFAGAMKGKKTVLSLQDAVSTTLAHAKIAASEIADRIEINLKHFGTIEQKFLFADLPQLVLKTADDFVAVAALRVSEHTAKEQERAAAKPAPVLAAVPAPAQPANVVPLRGRPTDDQIIATLSAHYNAQESMVLSWLLEMNLESALDKRTATAGARP